MKTLARVAVKRLCGGKRGVCLVSKLNDIKVQIELKIQTDGLDAASVKGKIGLKAGKVLAFINANTPDDPEAVAKLTAAVKEILNLTL
jgi:hypothetical protein